MQTFKLGLVINLSKSVFLVASLLNAFESIAQVKGNSNVQIKSPNANSQIGIGNVNKHQTINKLDNRKYYRTQNDLKNENNNYSGPLINGNNPFIIIHNTTSNFDSIKYEIQLKKRTIRIALAQFMNEGYLLKRQCSTDTNYIDINNKTNFWSQKVFTYLLENLDEGYARQFDLAENNDGLLLTGSITASNLWNFIRARTNKLDNFISSLY